MEVENDVRGVDTVNRDLNRINSAECDAGLRNIACDRYVPHHFLETGPQGRDIASEVEWRQTENGVQFHLLLLTH
jgi:hypothetical protein